MSSSIQILPAAGRIVIREVRGSSVTESGLILVNDIKREGHLGEVIEVSEDWGDDQGNTYKSAYSKGNIIVFGKYTGTDIQIDRENFIILAEKDILCTLKNFDLTPRPLRVE